MFEDARALCTCGAHRDVVLSVVAARCRVRLESVCGPPLRGTWKALSDSEASISKFEAAGSVLPGGPGVMALGEVKNGSS